MCFKLKLFPKLAYYVTFCLFFLNCIHKSTKPSLKYKNALRSAKSPIMFRSRQMSSAMQTFQYILSQLMQLQRFYIRFQISLQTLTLLKFYSLCRKRISCIVRDNVYIYIYIHAIVWLLLVIRAIDFGVGSKSTSFYFHQLI